MPIVREFVRGTHKEDSNYDGWVMKGMDTFDPVLPDRSGKCGITIAHDVLEHFSATDTSLEAEFLAFGSMLYLRGEPDYWAHHGALFNSPGGNMGSDPAHFLYDAHSNGVELRKPPRHRKLDEELEEILLDLFVSAQRTTYELVDDIATRWKLRAQLKRAVGWMRVGYRNARDRWNMGLHERIELFDLVADLRMPDIHDYEIESFKVIVEPKLPRAYIEIVEREMEPDFYGE